MRRPWKRWELNYLEIFHNLRIPHKQIAVLFDRPLNSIDNKVRYAKFTQGRRGQPKYTPLEEEKLWPLIEELAEANCTIKDMIPHLKHAGFDYTDSQLGRKIKEHYPGNHEVRVYLHYSEKRTRSAHALKGHRYGTFGCYKTANRAGYINVDPFRRREVSEPETQ